MDTRYRIYEGNEPYIFISYSHLDSGRVKPVVKELMDRGYRVWYDSGIEAGEEWPAYIADHLQRCGCFIPFLTAHYMRSDNCRQELHYALKQKRNLLPVYLEQVSLSAGLDMQLSPIQALMFFSDRERERFMGQLTHAAILKACEAEKTVITEEPVTGNPPERPADEEREEPGQWLKKNGRLLVVCGALILAVVLGAFILRGGRDDEAVTKEPAATQAAPETEVMAEYEETQAVAVEVTENPLENTMLTNEMTRTEDGKDDNEAEANESFFGMSISRNQVGTLTFLDTLAQAPADATDVSMLQNGKVKAWAVKNGELYDVYIAAEGGVYAPADSSHLLRNLSNATEIRFGDAFRTDNAESLQSLLGENKAMTAVDVSGWNTENAKDMAGLFSNCTALTELDLSNFVTDKVTEMYSMFFGCESLTKLNISSFETGNVTSFYAMFYNCKNLTELDVSNFSTGAAESMRSMFSRCEKLTELAVTGFNTVHVKDLQSMFRGCGMLKELDLSGFRTGNVTNMSYMFYECEGLEKLDISNFSTAEVTDMQTMFAMCRSLKELDLSGFRTGKVKSIENMFHSCESLTELDLSSFDTAAVENMSAVFYKCSSLQDLDLTGFDTANVTDMSYMFRDCAMLRELDLSGFNTAKVTNMYGMFYGCGCAENLDIDVLDTSSVDISNKDNYNFFMSNGVKPGGKDWMRIFK